MKFVGNDGSLFPVKVVCSFQSQVLKGERPMIGMNRGIYRYFYSFTSFWGRACFGLAGCVRV